MANITLRRPWRSPFTPLLRDGDFFGGDLRRVFDSMFDQTTPGATVEMIPAVDVEESEKEFTCTTELPGMKQKDVTVTFDDGVLTIKGEKMDEHEKKDGNSMHLWERSYGAFERSLTFPKNVTAEKITASFADGVLTVRLPKIAEQKKSERVIPVGGK